MADSGTGPTGRGVSELVRDAGSGDSGAMEELLSSHLPLVYGIVGRALNGHADVDDLVQDVMLRIVRGLPGLREPERFRSWAVAITYREIQQHQRRTFRDRFRRNEVEEVADPLTDFAERTVAELELTGQRRDLARAARWLDADDRRLLALWWEEEAGRLTRAEVAVAVGLDPGHTAVRIRRMKVRLEAARTVVRALAVAPRCPGLADAAAGWDGGTGALWRKRLTRHVRGCPQCGEQGAGLVAPEKLLPGLGLVPLPGGLLDGMRHAVETASVVGRTVAGRVRDHVTAKSVTASVAVLAVVTGGLTYPVWHAPAPSPRAAPPAAGPPAQRAAPAPSRPAPVRIPAAPASGSPSAAATSAGRTGGAIGVTRADIYLAPDGSDSGDGSRTRPYATLGKAASVVRPGQTIAMRGGTYRPDRGVALTTDGAAGRRITLSNVRGERPVIDASAVPASDWAVTQQADHWTVQGLEIRGSASHAYVCRGCRNTVFRGLSLHHNAKSGLTLRDAGTEDNSVLDSDFHSNGPKPGGGVGLGVKFGSGGGNVVRGCRAFGNGADGIDLGGFTTPVTVESSWSYRNGNGFTLGGGGTTAEVAHVLTDDAAWDNTGLGFNDEGNAGAVRLTRNTAFRNGTGFYLPSASAVLTANAAVGNAEGPEPVLADAARSEGNTWDGGGAGPSMFATTDSATAESPRTADAALPRTAFLAPDGQVPGARMAAAG
ncbi:sigma-70 family RNA polymerase sigma factor [Streptomyces clavifer]|uniref:sigma-70 family RNA polymerase sigma factor n=1 Tax=Streptomyces clavifer TaxID=68188 RepID=UPI002E80A3BB|nr:sigma-70 family RNA polymerase sigma factor [Streptomyces clavifer]WUC29647.1 sigma-70 family RNA polymerase sigma factor [Streptomyces clavifer]